MSAFSFSSSEYEEYLSKSVCSVTALRIMDLDGIPTSLSVLYVGKAGPIGRLYYGSLVSL